MLVKQMVLPIGARTQFYSRIFATEDFPIVLPGIYNVQEERHSFISHVTPRHAFCPSSPLSTQELMATP